MRMGIGTEIAYRRTLRAVAGVGMLLVTLGYGLPVAAAAAAAVGVEEVVLQVKGLACPFCAYGLEKKLRRIEGIESLTIEMDTGQVTVTVADRSVVTPEQVERAVSDAGFSLDRFEMTVSGALERVPEGWVLAVAEGVRWPLRFAEDGAGALAPGSSPDNVRVRAVVDPASRQPRLLRVIDLLEAPGDGVQPADEGASGRGLIRP